ncbi:MAG: Uma2 family endonuclease [Chloroflexi bacterium]|nr:Uma2 family endonuclease [Chloroflexota bacterium]
MVTQELSFTEEKLFNLKMTYEEYLIWASEDIHAEWVHGEVIILMPTKPSHQRTLKFLYELLTSFVQLFELGEVQIAPLEMKLNNSSREPDILFIATQNQHRLTVDRLEGPADLVVEIISNDSVRRDRHDKFKEYREANIPEYWIIDSRPGKQRADFYYLDEDGDYTLFATEDDEQVYSQAIKGFWLRPSWIWRAGELDPFLAFCEMRGLSPEKTQEIQQLLRDGQ